MVVTEEGMGVHAGEEDLRLSLEEERRVLVGEGPSGEGGQSQGVD